MPAVVIIPAYKPDEKLLETLASLKEAGFSRLIVIDDGSGPEFSDIFARAAEFEGVRLLRHPKNLGKGRAIKTGFCHVLEHMPEHNAVVCDADGQHPASAAARAASLCGKFPDSLVLGSRRFFGSRVPLSNLVGNMLTRLVFLLLTGIWFGDTQCGLRGYTPKAMHALLEVAGERYEYENRSLLCVRSEGISVVEFPMDAVYIDENSSSHFNKVTDSARVYRSILSFAAPPFLAWLLCIAVFIFLRGYGNGFAYHTVSLLTANLAGWLCLASILGVKAIAAGAIVGAAHGLAYAALVVGVGLPEGSAFALLLLPACAVGYGSYLHLRYGRKIRVKRA